MRVLLLEAPLLCRPSAIAMDEEQTGIGGALQQLWQAAMVELGRFKEMLARAGLMVLGRGALLLEFLDRGGRRLSGALLHSSSVRGTPT